MNWQSVLLGDEVDVLSGYAWKASEFNKEGYGLPIIRIQNVDPPSQTDFVYWDGGFDNKFIVDDGDILLTLSGSFRIGVWDLGEALLNQRVVKLTPSEKLDKTFFLHFMRTKLQQIEAMGKHALVNNVSISDLKHIEVPLPALSEQKRIAAILDKADALRAKRRAALAKLDTLLQATFLDMFGDPVTNPKGWSTLYLSECLLGKAANGYFAKSDKYNERGTPIIWISDFLDQFYTQTKGLKRVAANTEAVKKNQVSYGDVLFCRSSLTPAGIGKAAVVPPNLSEDTMFECHIIRCTLNQDLLLPEFFRVFSDTPYFRGQVIRNAKTATMTTISQQGIIDNRVIVPPLELQQRFKKFCRRVLAHQDCQSTGLEILDTFSYSLQQRAFKGEL